jgi:6,7-dimethyl-8-ribityllumazine synthase
VAVIVSRYNATITDMLLAGALGAYEAAGTDADRAVVVEAPGAFELVALALAAASTGRFRGVVILGCIIKGETRHDEYLAHAVAHGAVGVTLQTGVPVSFGVLTTDTVEQAQARAGGAHGNKGAEAMEALLQTIAASASIGRGSRAPASSPLRPDKAGSRGRR